MSTAISTETDEPEQPSVQALELITRAEIDMQVATAKRFPRDLERFSKRCMALVQNPEVAKGCNYSVPRAGKKIAGPSIRLAEIILSNYGNVKAGSRVLDEGPKSVTCQGVFFDMESNTYFTSEATRRITDKSGRRYNDDMINMTARAGCAVALRDAILKAVPQVHWGPVYEAALETMRNNAEPFAKAVTWFATRGVSEAVLLGCLGRESAKDVTKDDIVTLRGYRTSMEDGSLTAEQLQAESGAARDVSLDETRDAVFPDAATAPEDNDVHKVRIEIANLRHELTKRKLDAHKYGLEKAKTLDELVAVRNKMLDVLNSYEG